MRILVLLTYRHLSASVNRRHLPRYVNEFAGRHNVRSMDAIRMMAALARGMAGRQAGGLAGRQAAFSRYLPSSYGP